MYNEPSVRMTRAASKLEPPLDSLDVTVRLEVEGVTAAMARSEFGYEDTFALSEMIWRNQPGAVRLEPTVRRNWVAAYLHGVSFAIPVLICALAMYWLGYSLWGGDMAVEVASAIATGTVSSFLVTGGFVQGMARRSLFYLTTGAVPEAAGSCLRWCRVAASALVASGVAGLALNAFFGWFPPNLAGTALAFHLALGALWLSCSVLYVLDWNLALGLVTLAGLGLVGWLRGSLAWPLVSAQLAGIALASGIASALAVLIFRRRLAGRRPGYPKVSLARTLYLAGPYFAYGVLYYLFLFTDRLIAWTAGTNGLHLPLWFRGDYEIPLDIALAAFVLQMGWVHPALLKFQDHLRDLRRTHSVDQAALFNGRVIRYYWRRSAWFLVWAVMAAAGVFAVAWAGGWLRTPAAAIVAIGALNGYLFLVYGLWNASLLFSLSMPKPMLTAIAAALAINTAGGYVVSRVFSYEAAVAGFAAGAAVLAFVSTHGLLERLRSLDYYHVAGAL